VRSTVAVILALFVLVLVPQAKAGTGTIRKVLPFFLDQKGQHTVSPSLFDRDGYQAYLRSNPELRSGLVYRIRYSAVGKAWGPLKIRLQLRGIAQGNLPKVVVIERGVQRTGWFGRWASIELTGEDYRNLGEVTAWRVTLWEGDDLLLDQEQSFLW
jgi:hypothetical protein